MEIDDGKLKKLVLVLAVILAVEIAASFYTYGSIWHLADPMLSGVMDWVLYVSLVVYGTVLVAILLILAIAALISETNGDILACGLTLIIAWFAASLTVWTGIAWIEQQASLIIPNARIVWTVVLGGYLGILCLCVWWLSDEERDTG